MVAAKTAWLESGMRVVSDPALDEFIGGVDAAR
jgi:hypothetical protein